MVKEDRDTGERVLVTLFPKRVKVSRLTQLCQYDSRSPVYLCKLPCMAHDIVAFGIAGGLASAEGD